MSTFRRRVDVVAHTHWDREWYEPFPRFRMRLVALLDELIPRLEREPEFTHFLLDGQMAAVDDYLAVRPEMRDRLSALARSGRIAMGPWYTLMDEFLVSGETIVRDLELGLAKAREFGGAMDVGYLPDMFGHIAQMPQILRQFGFEHATVWRGVPNAIDRTGFWWTAPDGSTVRAEYLPTGYGNGAGMPEDRDAFLHRIAAWERTHASMLGDDASILWMIGSDHQRPPSHLARVVGDAASTKDDNAPPFDLRFTTLSDHVRSAPTSGLPRWTGELRSGARANLLMGVASNRTDVKQAAARAERSLERVAEPLYALFFDAAAWPTSMLDEAWIEVVRNAAHDSVCACSADEVVDAVLHRYATATSIATALVDHALEHLPVGDGRSVLVNLASHPRRGIVEITRDGAECAPYEQLVAAGPQFELLHTVDARLAPVIVERELDIYSGEVFAVDVDAAVGEVVIRTEPGRGGRLVAADALAPVVAAATADATRQMRIVVQRKAFRRVVVGTTDVPAYGWATLQPVTTVDDPVVVDGLSMRNATTEVRVDPTTGTWSLNGVAGFGRLVDEGDGGDTYNFSPIDDRPPLDAAGDIAVEVLERGPWRARLRVRAHRTGFDTTTTLTLSSGDGTVHVECEIDNRARDHRLRAWFPLPESAASSRAECAFAVVERGLDAEGGATEVALATFPSRRFVQAGGLTFVHEGLLEYELVDIDERGANALAITLLRCTGLLSNGPMRYRPLPAGPHTPLYGSQMPGKFELHYGVALSTASPYRAVENRFMPLLLSARARVAEPDESIGSNSALATRCDDGVEVSSIRRSDDGRIEIRVFNVAPNAARFAIDGAHGTIHDLAGNVTAEFDGSTEIAPGRIVTIRLRPAINAAR
ncbi:MAG: glycoside hydrolase family 38 C-terminal domain-containing protein [Acidimicrobiia bacterium]